MYLKFNISRYTIKVLNKNTNLKLDASEFLNYS